MKKSSAFVIVLAVSAVAIGGALLLARNKGIPIGTLTRDPNAIAGRPWYYGLLSQLGLLVWAAGAGACFSARTRFLTHLGLLTLLLVLDDAFLLHDRILPGIGVPELAVVAAYGAYLLFILVRFRAPILRSEWSLLALALAGFAVSVAVDALAGEPQRHLLEDGPKLVGIISWTVYCYSASPQSCQAAQ